MSFLFKVSRFELLVGSITQALDDLKKKLEDDPDKNEESIKQVLSYKKITRKWHKTIQRYQYITIAMYVGLYFSFTSLFFKDVFLVNEIISFLATIVSVTGTTIFIIVLGIAQYIKELHLQRLNILYAQIMLLCSYNGIKPAFVLEDDNNDYKNILDLLTKLDDEEKASRKSKRMSKKKEKVKENK
ncbi:MAG: hypothetical protein ACLFPL_05615 [Candidatus Nanoarchaeia archaeon]